MRKEFERVHLTARGKVAVLTMNHPEVLNAISPRMAGGMMKALEFAGDTSNGFRAVVITGEGRGFSSGANLAETSGQSGGPRDAGKHLEQHYHPLLRRIRDLELPILAAVNGVAAGVGMSIALMGDLVLAARSAYFLQAFTRIGLVPDGGSTWLLPRLIGLARARELSLLAEKLPAETALEWGLIFLMVAVFEESTLRGYLQFTLTRGIGFWWGALLLSVLFGFSHGTNPGETPVGLFGAAGIGLIFCLSLWYTGSLWWALGLHAGWDWAQSYFYGVSDSGLVARGHLLGAHPIGPRLWSGGTTGPEGSLLALAEVIVIALLVWAWWGRRLQSPFRDSGWRPAWSRKPALDTTPAAL